MANYDEFITEQRKRREELINSYRAEQEEEPTTFEYFPISTDWRVKVTDFKTRKPKPAMADYKTTFVRIGNIRFTLKGQGEKFDLVQEEGNEEALYIYLKDGTTGKSTYGLGRFVPVFKEEEEYFVDFNLAATPACGHVEGAACPWAKESTTTPIEAGEKASKH